MKEARFSKRVWSSTPYINKILKTRTYCKTHIALGTYIIFFLRTEFNI